MTETIAPVNGQAPPDVFSTPKALEDKRGPFERGWVAMAEAGHTGMTPLRKSDKLPAMKGVTGRLGVQLRPGEYAGEKSLAAYRRHNIGWRLEGYVGIDVDQYGNKHGAEQLAALEAEYGPLPAGPSSTSRGDGPSRIRAFRLPDGVDPKEEFRDGLGADIDVIQRHHRTIVVWPSVHPSTGQVYRWYDKHGNPMPEGTVPAPEDFPVLPDAWLEPLRKPQREHRPGAGLRVNEAIERWTSETDPDLMDQLREKFTVRKKSRHGDMLETLGWAMRMAQLGKVNAGAVLDVMEDLWDEAFDVPGSRDPAPNEFNDLVDTAIRDVPPPGADEDAAEGQGQADEAAQTRLEAMKAKLLDRAALKRIPRPEYLIEGWIRERSSSRTNGDPGSGKSLVVLDWAAHIGGGMDWCGHKTKKGTVLYLIAEGVETFNDRVTAWEMHHERDMEGVVFYPEPVQILERSFGALAESLEWRTFRAVVADLKPDLVVVDTQRRCTLAADENGNSDLQKAVAALDDMKRETGCAWHLVHHTPKNGSGGSGGGAVWGSVDSEFEMRKKGLGMDAEFTLESTKQKSGIDGVRMNFKLRSYTVDEDPSRDPFDNSGERSVVLERTERDVSHRADEVDLSVPEALSAKDKIRTLFTRVWPEGEFTQAQGWQVIQKAGVMERPTYYKNFTALRKDGTIYNVTTDKGAELQRYKIKKSE